MSLLYECINGIIQSGILESIEGTREGDEIAKLCVGKLRGMLVIEGDPNRECSLEENRYLVLTTVQSNTWLSWRWRKWSNHIQI